MEQMPDAKHGRSKEKRSDCKLLTLALVVDASGFVVKSKLYPGNVAEAATLGQMIGDLGADDDAVVVMDRGIATADNVAWLRGSGHRYIVVSRESTRRFDAEQAHTLVTASDKTVRFYKELIERKDDGESGETWSEAYLRCHSEDRENKENGIISRQREQLRGRARENSRIAVQAQGAALLNPRLFHRTLW